MNNQLISRQFFSQHACFNVLLPKQRRKKQRELTATIK
jgi:hypothetical protein